MKKILGSPHSRSHRPLSHNELDKQPKLRDVITRTHKTRLLVAYINNRKRTFIILWPWTLTFENNLDMIKYVGQRSLSSTVIVRTRTLYLEVGNCYTMWRQNWRYAIHFETAHKCMCEGCGQHDDSSYNAVLSGEFTCVGRADGLHVNPASCTSFYQCASDIAYLLQCPAGLLFDDVLLICNWPNSLSDNRKIQCAALWSFITQFHTQATDVWNEYFYGRPM